MKKLKKLLCLLLAIAVIAPALSPIGTTTVLAAKKTPKLNYKSVVIPMGSSNSYWLGSKDNDGYKKIAVKNKVKGAKYTFTSSNKKIVTIKSTGGYLTGIKPGTAKITVKQKLKGKTTTVGTCKVTVKAPKLEQNGYTYTSEAGSNFYLCDYDLPLYYRIGSPYMIYYEADKDNVTFDGESDSEAMIINSSVAQKVKITLTAHYKGNQYPMGYIYIDYKAPSTVDLDITEENDLSYISTACLVEEYMDSYKYKVKVISGADCISLADYYDEEKEEYYSESSDAYTEDEDGDEVYISPVLDPSKAYLRPDFRIEKLGTVVFEVFTLDGQSIGTSTVNIKYIYSDDDDSDDEDY